MARGECVTLLEGEMDRLFCKVDLTLLNRLLRLVLDQGVSDYVTGKNNVTVSYKDMSHINTFGVIRGLQFASFIGQFYGLVVDLIILGLSRAGEIAGDVKVANDFLYFRDSRIEIRHPVRGYQRYLGKLHMLIKLSYSEAGNMLSSFLRGGADDISRSMMGYNNKRCWPRDARMRMMRHDVNLGRAVF